MNLKPIQVARRRKRTALVVVTAFSVLLFGTAWKLIPRAPQNHLHAMSVEEREAVVLDLQIISETFTDLAKPADAFQKELLSQTATVADLPSSDKLVWKNNGSLVFSSRFFTTDSSAQEIALIKAFVTNELALMPPAIPAAVGGQD